MRPTVNAFSVTPGVGRKQISLLRIRILQALESRVVYSIFCQTYVAVSVNRVGFVGYVYDNVIRRGLDSLASKC